MRCCNCRYCYVDSWDESDWNCGIFGSDAEDMITEDKNGDYGCRYNSQFLKKKERELDNWWKTEQIKQAEAMELIPSNLKKVKIAGSRNRIGTLRQILPYRMKKTKNLCAL